ncbi:non-heme iron oxygenase ferredoxin subunit [Pseudoclavibacter sp. 13-3]|uniref:non-heme iron oxygenase ferredoxin subunit n=1 Tax=Pseudoclavibacter sp. 13-3 TaxID=2901228 RepID=UPI001E49AD4C|nr:non-heme iron oxygenase ferredoxin subunit [Pseudoclavibacter sp. 13-3]MCD7101921.1 non-heme iron oxygenase ferredoxin subunit [Pseudoclavibacter sp. 13-3]
MPDIKTGDLVRVCALDELDPESPLRVTIGDEPIALVKTAEGEVHAIGDRCSHGDISLSEGFVEGCTLECWAHGSKFDLKTGRPLTLPAYEPVAVYHVEVRDGDVYINSKGTLAQG